MNRRMVQGFIEALNILKDTNIHPDIRGDKAQYALMKKGLTESQAVKAVSYIQAELNPAQA